ncbi:MAG: hypothetical protein M3Q44_02840 [bacterium]|nr:hypothetical protein [bacterium]
MIVLRGNARQKLEKLGGVADRIEMGNVITQEIEHLDLPPQVIIPLAHYALKDEGELYIWETSSGIFNPSVGRRLERAAAAHFTATRIMREREAANFIFAAKKGNNELPVEQIIDVLSHEIIELRRMLPLWGANHLYLTQSDIELRLTELERMSFEEREALRGADVQKLISDLRDFIQKGNPLSPEAILDLYDNNILDIYRKYFPQDFVSLVPKDMLDEEWKREGAKLIAQIKDRISQEKKSTKYYTLRRPNLVELDALSEYYSAKEIAELFDVPVQSVGKWINTDRQKSEYRDYERKHLLTSIPPRDYQRIIDIYRLTQSQDAVREQTGFPEIAIRQVLDFHKQLLSPQEARMVALEKKPSIRETHGTRKITPLPESLHGLVTYFHRELGSAKAVSRALNAMLPENIHESRVEYFAHQHLDTSLRDAQSAGHIRSWERKHHTADIRNRMRDRGVVYVDEFRTAHQFFEMQGDFNPQRTARVLELLGITVIDRNLIIESEGDTVSKIKLAFNDDARVGDYEKLLENGKGIHTQVYTSRRGVIGFSYVGYTTEGEAVSDFVVLPTFYPYITRDFRIRAAYEYHLADADEDQFEALFTGVSEAGLNAAYPAVSGGSGKYDAVRQRVAELSTIELEVIKNIVQEGVDNLRGVASFVGVDVRVLEHVLITSGVITRNVQRSDEVARFVQRNNIDITEAQQILGTARLLDNDILNEIIPEFLAGRTVSRLAAKYWVDKNALGFVLEKAGLVREYQPLPDHTLTFEDAEAYEQELLDTGMVANVAELYLAIEKISEEYHQEKKSFPNYDEFLADLRDTPLEVVLREYYEIYRGTEEEARLMLADRVRDFGYPHTNFSSETWNEIVSRYEQEQIDKQVYAESLQGILERELRDSLYGLTRAIQKFRSVIVRPEDIHLIEPLKEMFAARFPDDSLPLFVVAIPEMLAESNTSLMSEDAVVIDTLDAGDTDLLSNQLTDSDAHAKFHIFNFVDPLLSRDFVAEAIGSISQELVHQFRTGYIERKHEEQVLEHEKSVLELPIDEQKARLKEFLARRRSNHPTGIFGEQFIDLMTHANAADTEYLTSRLPVLYQQFILAASEAMLPSPVRNFSTNILNEFADFLEQQSTEYQRALALRYADTSHGAFARRFLAIEQRASVKQLRRFLARDEFLVNLPMDVFKDFLAYHVPMIHDAITEKQGLIDDLKDQVYQDFAYFSEHNHVPLNTDVIKNRFFNEGVQIAVVDDLTWGLVNAAGSAELTSGTIWISPNLSPHYVRKVLTHEFVHAVLRGRWPEIVVGKDGTIQGVQFHDFGIDATTAYMEFLTVALTESVGSGRTVFKDSDLLVRSVNNYPSYIAVSRFWREVLKTIPFRAREEIVDLSYLAYMEEVGLVVDKDFTPEYNTLLLTKFDEVFGKDFLSTISQQLDVYALSDQNDLTRIEQAYQEFIALCKEKGLTVYDPEVDFYDIGHVQIRQDSIPGLLHKGFFKNFDMEYEFSLDSRSLSFSVPSDVDEYLEASFNDGVVHIAYSTRYPHLYAPSITKQFIKYLENQGYVVSQIVIENTDFSELYVEAVKDAVNQLIAEGEINPNEQLIQKRAFEIAGGTRGLFAQSLILKAANPESYILSDSGELIIEPTLRLTMFNRVDVQYPNS